MTRPGLSIPRIAFDTETELIEKGNAAPRLVCLSLAKPAALGAPQLFGRNSALTIIKTYFGGDTLLIGHNVASDFGVLCMEDEALIPVVFDLYERGLVHDTGVRQKLIEIREGRAIDGKSAKLAELAEKYIGSSLNKGVDSWRYWYGDLIATPLDQWPLEAKNYATDDAVTTLRVFNGQQALPENVPAEDRLDSTVSPDEIHQTRAAWVLHLMRMWGFRTDAPMVADLRTRLERDVEATDKRLLETGLTKITGSKKAIAEGRGEVSKDMKIIQARVIAAFSAMGRPAPTTDKGNVITDKDTLFETGDPDLIMLAEAGSDKKLLNTFIPLVEAGTKVPIAPRWNELVRSGRTSCGAKDDPGNWQNPSKKGGIRECVIPRPGYIFGGADYSQLELCTLAQILLKWFDHSEMATAIQAGRDLHLELACSTPLLLGHLSYAEALRLKDAGDEDVDKKRQFAKIANFGYPGGLGPESFVSYADGMGVKWPEGLTKLEASAKLKNAWLDRWPEMRKYFARIAEIVDRGQPVEQPYSGRLRGRPEFCSTANSMFQGLAADGAKEALWQVAKKCYVDKASPLFGSRIILFLHDELIIETPEEKAPEATDELSRTMVVAMQQWTPDIPIKAEPRLMRRWYKKAKEVRDAAGRLIVWEPKGAA